MADDSGALTFDAKGLQPSYNATWLAGHSIVFMSPDGLDLGAGRYAAGLFVQSKIAAGYTQDADAKFAGILINVDSLGGGPYYEPWPIGLQIMDNASTIGVDIGSCTTGIVLSGAMTDGILISGAMVDNAIEITGVCGGNAILVTTTTATTGLTDIELDATYTGTTQWESHEGLQSTVTYTPAGGSGSCWTQAIGGTVVINGEVDAQTVYKGIGANLHFAASGDYNGDAALAVALTASITTASGADIQQGNLAILHLNCASQYQDLTDTTGICTFLFFDADYQHGTGAMDSAMRFHTWQTPYMFDFPSGGYCDGFMDSGVQEGEDCVGHIKCRWNNATCYINVYSDNS